MTYDVIIIGGGPSGLMAAISASKQGANTALIDKGNKLGRKLTISGGGRCNVTNVKERDELIRNIPGNGRFLHGALSQFDNQSIIEFFEGLGIQLKEEDHGRMFPVTDSAQTVTEALVRQVKKQGVDVFVNSPVAEVLYEKNRAAGVQLANGKIMKSPCVIVATGGTSVPRTGSTGDGYPWAKKAGHTITRLFPTEVPITSNDPIIHNRSLMGLSLRDVSLTVWHTNGKKRLITHKGDLLFTHFGLSGPIALRCSQFVVKELYKQQTKNVRLTINLKPLAKNVQAVYDQTWQLAKNEPQRAIKNVLKGYLPERFIPILLEAAQLDAHITFDHIPKQGWMALATLITTFPLQANGTLSIEKAFVTGGGVHLKEIDPKTMQSRLTAGLFFCGEVLDVHGYTGGYNITAAFVTGHTAGLHAAKKALQSGR